MTDQDGSSRDASGASSPAGTSPDAAGLPTDGIVAARLAEIAARFDGQLDESQLAQVRRAIERQMVLAARLRRTPLTNADEPEIVFRPYRGLDDSRRGERGG